MKLRQSKKMCKTAIRKFGLKIVKTIKHLFIVKPHPNFLCMRWYAFTIAAENHPNLDQIIKEQKFKNYQNYLLNPNV